MILPNIKRIFVVTAISIVATLNVSAQDLIARQAPVDRKTKTADNAVVKTIEDKKAESVAAVAAVTPDNPTVNGLYDGWSSASVSKVSSKMPETFDIDLREFHMPTPSRAITSNFGPRWGRQHKGLDIKVYIGDTIRSAWAGTVRIVKYDANGYGNYVVIRHKNGLETVYGHLSKHLCKQNQVVKAGEVIGLGGNTGRSTGSHLHFETRLCGTALNPALFFDFRNQDVTCDVYHYNKNTYEREQAEATRLRGVAGKGTYTPSMVKGSSTPETKSTAVAATTQKEAPAVEQKAEETNTDTASPTAETICVRSKSGETLQNIASRKGVSIDKLEKLNPNLKNGVILNEGTKVRIG